MYTAYFVIDKESLLSKFPPKHSRIFAHHSTIEFKPKNLENIKVGEKYNLKVIGRVWDDKGDALLVENFKSKNKYPHITISCVEGVPPVYSNEMIEKYAKEGKIEFIKDKNIFIETIEGFL